MPDAFLHEDAARWIVKHGIRLLGIDTISVDAESSDHLPAHHILLEANVVIVESLDFTRVSPGQYIIACLPLKLEDCDGAPARVVLIEGLK